MGPASMAHLAIRSFEKKALQAGILLWTYQDTHAAILTSVSMSAAAASQISSMVRPSSPWPAACAVLRWWDPRQSRLAGNNAVHVCSQLLGQEGHRRLLHAIDGCQVPPVGILELLHMLQASRITGM